MLIEIINCTPLLYEEQNEHDKISALSHLIASHGYRDNIVISSRKTFKDAITAEILTIQQNNFAIDIHDSLNEYQQVKRHISFYVVVDFNIQNQYIFNTSGSGQKTIHLGYGYFASHTNLDLVKLLSESSLDFDFYKKIAQSTPSEDIMKLPFKLTFKNGGGSQTKANFDTIRNNRKICLCLVDTDKKHPNGREGTTSGSFSSIDRQFNSTAYVKVINSHEIESFIPEKIIENVLTKKTQNAAIIDSFDMLKTLNGVDNRVRIYFDHKQGLSLKKAIELDRLHGDFWLPILATENIFSNKPCLHSKICSNCMDCPKILGYGNDLLSDSIDVCDKMSPQKLTEYVCDVLKPYWTEIRDEIVSWGCIPVGKVSRS